MGDEGTDMEERRKNGNATRAREQILIFIASSSAV